jgi:hypothetical protein
LLPELVRATKYGKGPAVKAAAVDALALCCFVTAEDEHTTIQVLDHLQTLWKKGEGDLRAFLGSSEAGCEAIGQRGVLTDVSS